MTRFEKLAQACVYVLAAFVAWREIARARCWWTTRIAEWTGTE